MTLDPTLALIALAMLGLAVALPAVIRADRDDTAPHEHPCGCAWPDDDDDTVPAVIECRHGHRYAFDVWFEHGRPVEVWDLLPVHDVDELAPEPHPAAA